MSNLQFRRAVRENVPLLIGLAGASGSGKTYTAMTLATGMSDGKPFAVIDTEASRAKHYADRFAFDHADLSPQFRPATYLEAIVAADKAKYPVIVVDSMSHEWSGDGGVLDWLEEEWAKNNHAEWARMSSWIKPKLGHKEMVSKLLQVRAHVILCFRAEAKIDMVKNPVTGKTEVVDKKGPGGFEGWLPICEKNLPYELTASFLFMAEKPGVPKPMKLQEQHKAFFPEGKVVTEQAGRLLAEWARGGKVQAEVERPVPAREGAPSVPDGGGTQDAAQGVGATPSVPAPDPIKELAELLAERALSMKDLNPQIGATTRETARHAVTAWLIANPGKTVRDLVDAAVPSEQPTQAALA